MGWLKLLGPLLGQLVSCIKNAVLAVFLIRKGEENVHLEEEKKADKDAHSAAKIKNDIGNMSDDQLSEFLSDNDNGPRKQ